MSPAPSTSPLPVAVLGAGPVGLAAAAHLLEVGETPVVLEAGPSAGTALRSWAHVRLFSPWRYVVDQAAVRLLEAGGWQIPDPERAPTAGEVVDSYLEPLAAHPALAPHLRYNSRVTAVTRLGLDKLADAGREQAPFSLTLQTPTGPQSLLARAVIDATGTYGSPNPLGAGGVPALGEGSVTDRTYYGIPDVLGRQRSRYAGRRTMVVGSGHSAFNALLDLAALAEHEPGTEVTWVMRRDLSPQAFGGGADDELPERGALGQRARQLLDSHRVALETARITAVRKTEAGLVVTDDAGRDLPPVDEIIVTTGFRPDLSLLREVRLELDPSTEAPRTLAPLIDPNLHSCGTVPPHGAVELAHPERDCYIVGMKSYGRAPTFLLLTGYEQVRSVAHAVAGDWEAARRVELVLPETGVCSTDGGDCCGPATVSVTKRTRLELPLVAVSAGASAGADACGEGCSCG